MTLSPLRLAIIATVLGAGIAASIALGLRAPEAHMQIASVQGGIRETQTGSYLAGRHAENQNDLSAAADFMAEALRSDPDNVELQRRAMLLFISAGRAADALPFARKLREREPGAFVASLLLVAEAARINDMATARREYDRMSRDSLAGLVAPLISSWLRYSERGADEGIAELRTFGEAPPLRSIERLHAGLMNDLAGRQNLARERYQQSVDALHRPSFRSIEALAALEQRASGPEAARAVLAKHPPENPDSPVGHAIAERLDDARPYELLVRSPGEGIAEALFGLGIGLFRQSESTMALVFVRLANHARPNFALGQFFVGEMLEGMKRPEEAIVAYREIEAKSSLHWEARLRAVALLSELKRGDEAIERLKAMTAERPRRHDAPFRLGNVLRESERHEDAVAAYDQAIERLGEAESGKWALYYARGMALERAKKFDAAARDLERALALRPEHPYVLNYLGYMWVDQGRNLERARDMIRRAVELRPDDGYIVDSLGWFHFRVGEFAQAVRLLERAVELKPADPVINDHLGDAYWKVGRQNEARFQWRRALYFDAAPDLIDAIRAKLDRGMGPTPAANKG